METLEDRITVALTDGDDAQAAALLERAFDADYACGEDRLPCLLEELAEYYADLGRYDDAIATMAHALEKGWTGRPDGRCRIAEFLLRAGLVDEAAALYDEVRADTPDDVCVYHSAGVEYAATGRHERALAWLTDGLDRAVTQNECDGIVAQMLSLRRDALAALGRPHDELDDRAQRALDAAGRHAHDDLEVILSRAEQPPGFAFAWLPAADYERAVATWPAFAESVGGATHAEYSRALNARLQAFQQVSTSLRPCVAPVTFAEVEAWCLARGYEPGEPACRDGFASDLLRRGRVVAWPPGAGEPCWCGSEQLYDGCCGAS
ncbi:MAG: hypothetical protein M3O86_05670 [Actinomycetota bacterium]|nr:hypothetical protein [Actinomycetota bacterium]